MKKIVSICIMLITLFPIKILAVGSININTNDIYILKGESVPINVLFNNAAGRINITSSNNDIASISVESMFLDKNSDVVTINGIKNGLSVISVYAYDVSTYDNEDLSNNEYKINVYVYTYGDVNNDNKLDLIDVVSLLKKYLNNDFDNLDKKIGDMDNNGFIGLNDIILLIREYLNN